MKIFALNSFQKFLKTILKNLKLKKQTIKDYIGLISLHQLKKTLIAFGNLFMTNLILVLFYLIVKIIVIK